MKITLSELRQALGRNSRASSAELCAALKGVNRSTLTRLLVQIDDEVIRRGGSRRIRYALRRPLRGKSSSFPLFRIDSAGEGHSVATLDLAYPEGSALAFREPFSWPLNAGLMSDGWFDGLPYPLLDMQPQGFLGRNFAHLYSRALDVPDDLRSWSDDDVVHVLATMGSDQSGDLILGDRAYQRHLDERRSWESRLIPAKQVSATYPEQAELAVRQGIAGSSAGGEFPKFTAMRELDGAPSAVIVKFSGADDSPAVRRWSDLLVCEHLASVVLASELRIPAACSSIHQHEGRTFLEVVRFDRHGAHGCLPVCSLSSINGALLGMAGKPWPVIAGALCQYGWLSAEAASQITTVWWFGRLIANTDMHDGNLAFLPGLQLAPIYDMLPMGYAPLRGGELPAYRYEVSFAAPTQAREWHLAAQAAREFWLRCALDGRISAAFRAEAAQHADALLRTLNR